MRDEEKLLRIKINELEKKKNQYSPEIRDKTADHPAAQGAVKQSQNGRKCTTVGESVQRSQC